MVSLRKPLSHESCGSSFAGVFFKLVLSIYILGTSCEIGLGRMQENLVGK